MTEITSHPKMCEVSGCTCAGIYLLNGGMGSQVCSKHAWSPNVKEDHMSSSLPESLPPCKREGHNFQSPDPRSVYFKTTPTKDLPDMSIGYLMLYCTKCGEQKEFVKYDRNKHD